MAAGGLSYSGLVNHGKIGLPSVDSWGTNMHILRDPPKSITTRRIDKVGETSSITQMIDDSDGRSSEAIQMYARGVNPSVSVSYNNYGNNGGQTYGGITEGGRKSAKLPYRIIRDGAFRPPVLLQEDLLPLSRMPRSMTSAFSNSGFTDFSRKMRSCGTAENTKEVKTDTLKSFVRPTAVYQIEKSAERPFEVKYVIQPTIKNSVTSGIRSMDITHRHTGEPTKEISNNMLHKNAHSAVSDVRYVDNNEFKPDRFLQNSLAHSVASNASSTRYNLLGNNELETGRFLQDPLSHHAVSNISYNGNIVDNNELETGRFLQDPLSHHAVSNISYNGNIVDNNNLETGRFLQDPLSHHAVSNISYNGNIVDNNQVETGRFLQDPLSHHAVSNISSIGNITDNNQLETGRFVQNPLSYHVVSNISSKNNHTSIEDILDLADMPVHHDVLHYSVGAPLSGVEQTKYFHNDISLSRSLPNFNATTNAGDQKIYKRHEYDNQIELQRNKPSASCESNLKSYGYSDISSRDARLNQKINAGGYSIPAQIPMKERSHIYYPTKESEKAKMNRQIMESMNGRFNKFNPFVEVK